MEAITDILELSTLREREDHVEFKEAKHNYPFAGGKHVDIRERRRCVLGYVVALANEKGGRLVLGMSDQYPHTAVGSDFAEGKVGQLEDEIYERLHIRVHCCELFDNNNNRVLVIQIPSRPVGKALRFEGVPLMRVGESLREMDDQEYFSILQEQDPDFSAKICKGLSVEDLSEEAIENMRQLIFKKRNRPEVLNTPLAQLLTDLGLLRDDELNYAALILLGKRDVIKHYLPQNNIVVEYRISEHQIRYSARKEFCEPLFVGVDMIWRYINQAGINPLVHIDDFPQVIDVPSFTEETVREAILNSLQHRSFQMGGDILIKISPGSILISNTGGFPYGVNLSNILTVNSSPRNRRLAEVIEKAGLIERSGQGVDTMFANCISEGRKIPDYTASDDFQVTLRIESAIVDPIFRRFITNIQSMRDVSQRLNVFDLHTLYSISHNLSIIYERSLERLISEDLIIKHPIYGYEMGNDYFRFHRLVMGGHVDANTMRRLYYILAKGPKSMSAFMREWEGELTIKQIRSKIEKLVGTVLIRDGRGKGTTYRLVN
ncbi:MAG: putative DNA binding domain-containing protein [Paramuribaculum sp.]|nr:putative DNA binding domain-containing protein [Paramuribaculum sp.]